MKLSVILFAFISTHVLAINDSVVDFQKSNQSASYNSDADTLNLYVAPRKIIKKDNIFEYRLAQLNQKTPMRLVYNEQVQAYINSYLNKNKRLVSRMLGLAPLYFPLFEEKLDKYKLPIEFKYLAIVESALNPRARSKSGAVGLWQFMYATGKQYGLNVTSYMDDRQDPIKSTESACKYFLKLYDTFGDWNLVLAAYNGGPGYIQRKIIATGLTDFWELSPYLRTETRNYVPAFIAVNYVMNYHKEHNITIDPPKINITKVDTFIINKQTEFKVLSELLCVSEDIIKYLNPAYKEETFPSNSKITLPIEFVSDFVINEPSYYAFLDAVDNKEILIDEDRIIYTVLKGDYLGKIAKKHDVSVHEIKHWNNMKSSHIDIADELVLYIKKKDKASVKKVTSEGTKEYIVQKGDTLWGIAQKYEGLSIWKIKALNNLDSDALKPGLIILLPEV